MCSRLTITAIIIHLLNADKTKYIIVFFNLKRKIDNSIAEYIDRLSSLIIKSLINSINVKSQGIKAPTQVNLLSGLFILYLFFRVRVQREELHWPAGKGKSWKSGKKLRQELITGPAAVCVCAEVCLSVFRCAVGRVCVEEGVGQRGVAIKKAPGWRRVQQLCHTMAKNVRERAWECECECECAARTSKKHKKMPKFSQRGRVNTPSLRTLRALWTLFWTFPTWSLW